MSDEKAVTSTIEYRHHEIKFSLVHGFKPPEGEVLPVWYIQADVVGFKKPFQTKFMESLFYRQSREEAEAIENPQEFLNTFVKNVKAERDATAEILDVTLDTISVMWYSGGRVAIEENSSLITEIKRTIDLLYGSTKDEFRAKLKETGWL